jgi:hypothetical protein
MKKQSAGFVNPFRNIFLAFVLRQAVATLAGIVPLSTLTEYRRWIKTLDLVRTTKNAALSVKT